MLRMLSALFRSSDIRLAAFPIIYFLSLSEFLETIFSLILPLLMNGTSPKMTDTLDKSANGASLERQVTLTLTPEQYERLFFQPSAPARGDYAKRFGNPTMLGTIGFLVPFTTTMLSLLQWRGASPASFNSISGSWFFMGGIAMNIAGICEFILGNSK